MNTLIDLITESKKQLDVIKRMTGEEMPENPTREFLEEMLAGEENMIRIMTAAIDFPDAPEEVRNEMMNLRAGSIDRSRKLRKLILMKVKGII